MSILIKVACQTIGRRLSAGESFEDVLKDYPKLTDEQIKEIEKELGIDGD